MDRKGSTLSSTDSFYFQLCPSHFKVEHSFAKAMKNGCLYRVVIYKGIQKMDEMAQGVRGKLIGGKIIFEQTALNFHLPIFSPTRNIEFTVKVFESRPNEQEVEIAQHKIKSGDYIKIFRNEGTAVFHQEAQLLESFVLVFDLFVQGTKEAVQQLVKQHQSRSKVEERSRINRNTPNKATSDNLSQSDISQNSREGGMFNSKKKLSRKRGHDGKMKSRHGSRENSEISSREGSVRSSKKAFGPFPHAQEGEHFVHSPKKASPPKVEDTSPPKPQQGKPQNLVSVARKDSNASEISKPKLPLTPTKPVKIESNIQRSESARKNPFSQRSDILPTDTPVPIRRDTLTRREQPAKATSPRNVHELEIKGTEKVFEIQQKKEEAITSSQKHREAYPPKNPTTSRLTKTTPAPQPKNQEAKTEKSAEFTQIIRIPDADLSPPEHTPASKVSQAKQQPQKQENSPEQAQKQGSQPRAPSGKGSADSRNALPFMALKGKQVLDQEQRGIPELKLKQSMNWKNNSVVDVDTKVEESAAKEFQSTKDKLFYVFFFIMSAFLFYNAVTPSRRV